MTCDVTIEEVLGIVSTPGGTIAEIVRITGTAGDCPGFSVGGGTISMVRVTLTCGAESHQVGVQIVGGVWSVDIPTTCPCGGIVDVLAECALEPSCNDTFSGPLTCIEVDCPAVDISVVAGDCNADGTRTITFSSTITNTTGSLAVLQWEFESGVFGASIIVPDSVPVTTTQTHGYSPGAYTPTLQTVVPSGCPPIIHPLTVAACPPVCPELVDIDIDIAADCNADGTRDVTFSLPAIFDTTITFGDGSAPLTFVGTSVIHAYMPPGPYTATISIEGCSDITVPIGPLETCPTPCPETADIGIDISDECNADGTRNVTFTLPGTFEVTVIFGDGSVPLMSTSASITHAYAPTGPYTATFDFTGIADCEINLDVGPLESCPSDNGDDTPSACGAATLVIAALLAVALGSTLVALTLQVCLGLPVPPLLWGIIAGLWIAVAIAIAISLLLCSFGICPCLSSCDWLAISWIVALAGSIVAAFLAGCCPVWMWWVAIGFFVTAATTFSIWLSECDPGTCQVLDNLAVAVVTGAGTVLSYLLIFPAIAACGTTPVVAIAGTIGGILVAAAAICHSTSD